MTNDAQKTVLLVDDNTQILGAAYAALVMAEYTVKMARNPADALARLDDSVDLVVTDLNMDGDREAGIKLAQAVKERRPGLPVILTSSHYDGALPEGVDRFVPKKMSGDFSELLSIIEELLSGPAAGQAEEDAPTGRPGHAERAPRSAPRRQGGRS